MVTGAAVARLLHEPSAATPAAAAPACRILRRERGPEDVTIADLHAGLRAFDRAVLEFILSCAPGLPPHCQPDNQRARSKPCPSRKFSPTSSPSASSTAICSIAMWS